MCRSQSRRSTTEIPKLTPEQRAKLEAQEERRLFPEALATRVAALWTKQEREDFQALVSWFHRRYPTPIEPLWATRHRAAQW